MAYPSKVVHLAALVFIAAATASLEPALAADSNNAPRQLVMATEGVGGVANTMGSGFAALLTKYSGTKATLLPIGQPDKWVSMMKDDEIDLGLTAETSLSWVYWGTGPRHPKSNKIYELVAVGAPATWGFVVLANTPVKTPSELKKWLPGKRLTYGWVNPAVDHLDLAYLANLGFKSVKGAGIIGVPVSSYRIFVSLWNQQRVDVVGMPTGIPLLQEMNTARPGHFIGVFDDPAAIARMQSVEPSYYVSEQPPTVLGVTKQIPMLTYNYAIVARSDLSAEVVEHILSTLYGHQKQLGEMGRSLMRWLPAKKWASVHASMPYHPGAVAFYKAKGLWTSAMEMHQEKYLKEAKGK